MIKKSNIIIKFDKVSKTFLNGKLIANDSISFDIYENDIHAIVGENGAGKSTLVSILFGSYEKDSGTIFLNDKEINFTNSSQANKSGIGMVHQHFKLVQNFTVYENIIIGNEICKKFLKDESNINKNLFKKIINNSVLDNKKAKEKIKKLIDKYNFGINLDEKVKNLSVDQQQKVEILKVLYLNSKVLIFDEPTALLPPPEIKHFLKMLKDFKNEGKTILLITHKLDEVFEVADRITVMNKGKMIKTLKTSETNIDKITELMIGKKIDFISVDQKNNFGSDVLVVKNLLLNKQKESYLNFNVREGEIVAVAGISGSGQSELAQLITGITKSHGEIYLKSTKTNNLVSLSKNNKTIKALKKRYYHGMGFVPEDRQKYGLFMDDSIAFNSVMNRLYENKFRKLFFFINNNRIKFHATELINKYDVRGALSLDYNIRYLSGGNQQKLVFGREVTKDANFHLLYQPTRGLDIGAIEYIHSEIIKFRNQNKGILLFSYEIPEILALADRVIVLNDFNITGIIERKDLNLDILGKMMVTKKIQEKER